jgi:DNA-binding beta-propeller fold protein YncE
MQGTTPYKIALHPGSHTILLTLDGYRDYTTTVNLQAGYPVAFDAQLQRALTASVIRENMSEAKTIVAQPGVLRTIIATADNTIACLSGQECLTLAEAGGMYAPGWYYTEGSVCGYNGSIPKYCIGGSPKMTVQPGAVQAAVSIRPENTVRIVNASHDIAGNLPVSPLATPRILGAQQQVGFVDSILGFFSGLFGQKVSCPMGTVNCGGGCVDTNTDSLNCGACAYTCFDPAICCFGSCEESCDYCSYAMQWGTEGSASGQFKRPQGIAVDSAGNVYVADTNNNRIQKFNSAGGIIATWGNSGAGSGQFSIPAAIALDSVGNIYVAESGNNRVQKFNSMGGYISQWGTLGSGYGQFIHPHGIAIDSSGNVYVTDYGNDRVQKFNSNGEFISLLGTGARGSGNGQFLMPFGVAIDPSGNFYTIEIGNQRVQRFDSGGNYVDRWGTRGSGSDQFEDPMGIATDSFGNVYVTDSGNNRVQKFSCVG